MSAIIAFKPSSKKKPATPSALDIVVAHWAREHDEHIAPIVGCYQCLHNEPRSRQQQSAAA
jgi:hypothetical protein